MQQLTMDSVRQMHIIYVPYSADSQQLGKNLVQLELVMQTFGRELLQVQCRAFVSLSV